MLSGQWRIQKTEVSFLLLKNVSLSPSGAEICPLPLSALIDNNADVRLRENDPKYGDDSKRAIMSRFYQTATVSDVKMANVSDVRMANVSNVR